MHPTFAPGIQINVDVEQKMQWFRGRCAEAGLPCTHQRQVLYRALLDAEDHPSPEMLFGRVKRDIPNVSLATVYRNIHIFLDHALIGEVSLHHGSLRLEANNRQHHHMVCRQCRRIFDLPAEQCDIHLQSGVSHDFQPERYSLAVHGLCNKCVAPKARRTKTQIT